VEDTLQGILLRPCARSLLDLEEPWGFESNSSLQHYHGWCPPTQHHATLCGAISRAIALSSSAVLAQTSLVEALEAFLAAGFPSQVLYELTRRWDKRHHSAKVCCADAASAALATFTLRRRCADL
jgi:hypothetical protein